MPKGRTLYINLEDERLEGMQAKDLHANVDAFYRHMPTARGQTCFLFFDEVQNVPGWERFVRRLLDTEDVEIAITGSSAKMLSKEVATTRR